MINHINCDRVALSSDSTDVVQDTTIHNQYHLSIVDGEFTNAYTTVDITFDNKKYKTGIVQIDNSIQQQSSIGHNQPTIVYKLHSAGQNTTLYSSIRSCLVESNQYNLLVSLNSDVYGNIASFTVLPTITTQCHTSTNINIDPSKIHYSGEIRFGSAAERVKQIHMLQQPNPLVTEEKPAPKKEIKKSGV